MDLAAAPGAGSRFLNVEDAEELREQRSMLVYSAISCCLSGVFLLILSVGPVGAGEAGNSALTLAAGLCLVAAIVSGAGPTVLAFSDGPDPADGDAASLLARCPEGWRAHRLEVDREGARLT